MRKYFKILLSLDWVLLGAVVLLIAFSLSALYSIAVSSEVPNFLNFQKQIIAASIGLFLIFVLSFIDYRVWVNISQWIYGAAVALLVGVLFFGRTIAGTTGWFSFFGISFQPVEIAKIGLIVTLAWFLSRKMSQIKEMKTFLMSAGIVGFLFLLVMMQPDFGSGVILLAIWFIMLYLAGANKKQLLSVLLLGIVAIAGAWFFLFQDYQRERILTFVDPSADPYGRGYQVRQAIIAVGAGGLFGRGLGFGSQSQLKFIPASQTDFIFAVIAEELGFLGIGLILFLWGLIFYRFKKAVSEMRDTFAMLFILGISVMFFIQIFINIGMNIGMVPVTGIPLPFLSAGGSFMVISLAAIGLVQSMIVRNK